MKRGLRVVATLVVTALATWYVLSQVDVRDTAALVADADLGWLLLAFALTIGTVPFMAWRWQRLLRAKGIEDRLPWLTRTYLVSYSAGQVLPTAVGGDALRIFETTRRHPGHSGTAAGSVLLERALGGAATLALAAVGFLLAIGRYDVGAYLWLEFFFVVATIALAVAFFSRRVRPLLRRSVPAVRRLRLERPLRGLYDALHAYRAHAGLLGAVFALTIVIQAVRILAIWLSGEAVGIELSPRPYYVMGPLLFLVMLVPFTVNGLAVRESFFVSFLGNLAVDADAAFAAGFVFFVVTLAMSLPGGLILAWEGLRGPRARVRHGHG